MKVTSLEKVISVWCPMCGVAQPLRIPLEQKEGITTCVICEALFKWESSEADKRVK